MTIWTALTVFLLTILLEILAVKDYYATLDQRPIASAVYTGLCALVAGVIVIIYVHNQWMIAVDAAGASVGAYVAVKYFIHHPTVS